MPAFSPLRSLTLGIGVLAVFYLLFWPVPIEPVAWDAPADAGLVGPFAPNDRLASIEMLNLGEHGGPEDLAAGPDGYIYASTEAGRVIRFSGNGRGLEVFATTDGRPLGLEFDDQGNLLVANAVLGLQRIDRDGKVELLIGEIDGEPLTWVNDVAVANDGTIYFTRSSTRFAPADWGGTYAASLLDLLEHGGRGRLLAYDPSAGSVTELVRGLNYANGVAISDDQHHLLVNETGHYRVWRYTLEGPSAVRGEVVIDNLPGFPDNLNNGMNGRYWLGLVAPRNALLDRLSGRPYLRRVVQRLPAFLRPSAAPSSHVVAIDGDGAVLVDLQDPAAGLPALTGVLETPDALYLSTLFGHRVGRLDKRELARR